jgi:hypothetical protein
MTPTQDQLILDAAKGKRTLTSERLREIQEHVARAWYNLSQEQRVSRELSGIQWKGRFLQLGDTLPTDVVHYLKHVVARREWPLGTGFDEYRESLRNVIRDPESGLLTSMFRDKGCHLSIVRRSGEWQGPGGYEWLFIEYRESSGNLATAFQLEEGLSYLDRPGRRDKLWLRRPRQTNELTLD